MPDGLLEDPRETRKSRGFPYQTTTMMANGGLRCFYAQ
jgi:hypothetical protein